MKQAARVRSETDECHNTGFQAVRCGTSAAR